MSDPTVGELSEGEILARILARLSPSRALLGPGDDAAVIAAPSGRFVATVDTLVHGPDFRLAWSNGFDLGWKAAAVNLADVAAMGARPTALLVALAMPDATRASFVEHIADGLRAACEALAPGCAVEGGDLTVSDTLVVAVTALGVLDAAAVTRSGARPGDIIAIAGDTGVAARGLDLLFSHFTDASGTPIAISPAALRSLSDEDGTALSRQLRPFPPVALGPAAASAGASAMMDVSDGLVLDASRMAVASTVTLDFDRQCVGDDPLSLSGGEDHALLATFPPSAVLPEGFRAVGAVRDVGAAPVTIDGEPYDGESGWDPYRDWDSARG